jgi:hypothetical protein
LPALIKKAWFKYIFTRQGITAPGTWEQQSRSRYKEPVKPHIQFLQFPVQSIDQHAGSTDGFPLLTGMRCLNNSIAKMKENTLIVCRKKDLFSVFIVLAG